MKTQFHEIRRNPLLWLLVFVPAVLLLILSRYASDETRNLLAAHLR